MNETFCSFEETVGRMIYSARKRRGYTIAETAKLAKVSPNTMRKCEIDSGNVKIDALIRVCEILECNPVDLLNAAHRISKY